MIYTIQLHHEIDWPTPTIAIYAKTPKNEFWEIVDENGERLVIADIEFYPTQQSAQQQLDNYVEPE